jgi:NADPH-dependent 2,4-dienoyl-CoA reductase/sulfur reductase-like enzyme
MSEKVTRRGFLKTCGVVAGGIAATTVATEIAIPFAFKEKMAFDDNSSLWAPAQPERNIPLQQDLEVDVAIIGGGYTGLSCAYHLLQHDPRTSVAVFEARGVGQGASGRNGGMILPQPCNEYMQIVSDPETHKRTYDITVQNFNELAELIQAQGVDRVLGSKTDRGGDRDRCLLWISL